MAADNWPHTRRAVRRLRIDLSYLLIQLAIRICPPRLEDTTHDR